MSMPAQAELWQVSQNERKQLVQDEDGTVTEKWNVKEFQSLEVFGSNNTYVYSTSFSATPQNEFSYSFKLNDNASLLIALPDNSDDAGITVYGSKDYSVNLEISGSGTLEIRTAVKPNSTNDDLSHYSAFNMEAINQKQPQITIKDSINLRLYASRGIALEGGTFTYDCDSSDIYISGASEDGSGLLTGIIASSKNSANANESIVDITARHVTIYLAGKSTVKDNNELISSTVVGYGVAPPFPGVEPNSSIKIDANQINLIVDESYKPYSAGTCNGLACSAFGLYTQSGKSFASTIDLSGGSFSLDSQTSAKVYGLYLISHGQKSRITLNFDDEIRFNLKSEISGEGAFTIRRYDGQTREDAYLQLTAGKLILLNNELGRMIYSNGATIDIAAPDGLVKISSGNEIAVYTDWEASSKAYLDGGKTTITGKWVDISSTGSARTSNDPDGSGTAVVTNGDMYLDHVNGETNIIGSDIVHIYSQNATAINSRKTGTTNVEGNQVVIESDNGSAIITEIGGTTNITGNSVVIKVQQDNLPYTIWTDGVWTNGKASATSTTNVNYNSSTAESPNQTTVINGRLLATNEGQTNIGIGSTQSIFTGSADDGYYYQKQTNPAFGNGLQESSGQDLPTAGQISIYASHGSKWVVEPNPVEITDQVSGVINKWSNLYKYHSYDYSLVDLSTATPQTGQDLDINRLEGHSATFQIRTYIDNRSNVDVPSGSGGDETLIRDHVNILEGSGQHYIYLKSSGLGIPYLRQADYLVWSADTENTYFIRDPMTYEKEDTPGNKLSFRLGVPIEPGGVDQVPYVKATSKVDLGIYNYYLATRYRNGNEEEGVEFFLVRGSDYTPSTDTDRTLAGFGSEYVIWWAELSDLRKRLGEVRYGAQDGPWVRVITQKDDIVGVGSGRFLQKLYGLNLGYDHFYVQDEDRMWLLGGNLKFANANQRIKHKDYGHGDIHDWGLNLYATYANQYGCYMDLVLTGDQFSSKVRSRMLDNTPTRGSWHNYGLGASIEIGKMYSSTQDDEGWGPWYNHWWVEPQAQLAYYHVFGSGFSLSNGMKAKQGDVNFLTGRLGVVIGKKFNYGKDRAVVDKRYSQFYIKGGIKHEFLGHQRLRINDGANEVVFKGSLAGTRVYYGAGFDWNFSDQLRLYAQIEREQGSKYKKDYEISVGLKWQF